MSAVTLMEIKDRLVVSGKSSAECRKKEHSLPNQFQMGASLQISRILNGIRNGRFFIERKHMNDFIILNKQKASHG